MSRSSKKLSLTAAVFINLNVMIGTGLFVNTYVLSANAGAAGFLLYPMIGLLMLPLIAVFGKLSKLYPTGGLYAFAKESSPLLGFLSCWSYFFAKLASCATMTFVGTKLFLQMIPATQHLNPVLMSLIILATFTSLNLLNMKVGMTVQKVFLTAKCIPIIFALIAGVMIFDTSHITASSFIWEGILINVPLVLFCLGGFETACSISRNMENPSVDGPKAVYYSFATTLMLYGLFQGLIYTSTYTTLGDLSSYQDIFPCIAHKLFSSEFIANKVSILLNLAIGLSALGGSYGILFANSWNLLILAENNHVFGSSTIMKFNTHETPWVAVCAEALICASFLIFSQGFIQPLQGTAALGIIIAYTISAFAYFQIINTKKRRIINLIIACSAFFTCTLFIINMIMTFIQTGIFPLILFAIILISGTTMFYIKKHQEELILR